MVGKPAFPHLKFGSKAQLTDEVVAQAEEDTKAELAAGGKPMDKSSQVNGSLLLGQHKLTVS